MSLCLRPAITFVSPVWGKAFNSSLARLSTSVPEMILYPSKTRENPSSLLLLYIVCLETPKSAAICVQLLNSLCKDDGCSEGMTYLGLSGRAWRRFHLRSVWVAVNNRQLNNKTINCPQIFSQRFKFSYLRIRKSTSLVHVAHNVGNMPQST